MEISKRKYPLIKTTKKDLWEAANRHNYQDSVIEFLKNGEEDNILMCEFDTLSMKDKMTLASIFHTPTSFVEEETDMVRRDRLLFVTHFIKKFAQEMAILFEQNNFGQPEQWVLPLHFLDEVLFMTPFGLQIKPFSQSVCFEPLKSFLQKFVAVSKNETFTNLVKCLDMLEYFDDFERFNEGQKSSLKTLSMYIQSGWSKYELKIITTRLKQLGKL